MRSLALASNSQTNPLRTLHGYLNLKTLVLVPKMGNGDLRLDSPAPSPERLRDITPNVSPPRTLEEP
jgi:hypothetical protein